MSTRTPPPSTHRRLDELVSRYSPEVQRIATGNLRRLRSRLPGAKQLVYDNYNALVVAFSPTDRTADCLLSIALYPRWATLFFARGASFPGHEQWLAGSGKSFRHVVLEAPDHVDRPEIRRFIGLAVADHHAMAKRSQQRGEPIIKSIVAKQRPRQPMAKIATKSPANRGAGKRRN